MKRSILFSLAILALAGCAKEEITTDTDNLGKTPMTFTSDLTSLTKTILNNDLSISWSGEDAISVFSTADFTKNEKFTNTLEAGKTAKFQGTAIEGEKYFAVYPYKASNSFSGNIASLEIPAEQQAQVNSFETCLNPSVAVNVGTTFTFENVASLLSFKVPTMPDVDFVKAVIKGNVSEKISGNVTVDMSGETFKAVPTEAGTTTVSISGNLLAGQEYFFVLAPTDFSKGITVSLIDSKGKTYSQIGRSPLQIDAGKLISLGTLTVGEDLEYKVSTFVGSSRGHVDGPKATAKIGYPEGLILTPEGDGMILLQRDNNNGHAIRHIDWNGNVSTLVKGGLLNFPWHGGYNSNGDLYIANKGKSQILKMDTSKKVSLISIPDLPLSNPMTAIFDQDGKMWIVNREKNQVVKLNGTTVEKKFTINYPISATIDAQGNVLVGSGKTGYIHMIDKAGNVSTIAGIGNNQAVENPDGLASKAAIGNLNGIYAAKDGKVYMCDLTYKTVRVLIPDVSGDYSKGSVKTIAKGFYPSDVVVNDTCDKIYVSSATSHQIKLIEVIK